MRRLAPILGLIIVLMFGGIIALNAIRHRDSDGSILHVAPTDPLVVTVVQPQQQSIARTVQAPGQVEAVLEVEISSEVPAKIIEMPVLEGQTVKAGDVLCRLADDEYRAGVESGEAMVAKLRAAIRQGEADLAKCERDWERIRNLAEHDATNLSEVADFRTALVKARATVEIRNQELVEAQALLRRARENLAKTTITSPINGVVSQLHAKQGEVVVTGTMNNPGTVIMVITDLSQMQVRARVDETDVPLVKPDQPVRIYLPADPSKPVPGRVLRVATSGTKPTGRDVVTFETLILVESDDGAVKPAMTANLEIEVDRKESALTVPVQAVVHRRRKDLPAALLHEFEQRADASDGELRHKAQYLKVIYCMQDGKAQPRLVHTGIADVTHVELLEGVTLEDQVITGPYRSLDRLKEGTLVKLDDKEKSENKNAPTQLASGNTASR